MAEAALRSIIAAQHRLQPRRGRCSPRLRRMAAGVIVVDIRHRRNHHLVPLKYRAHKARRTAGIITIADGGRHQGVRCHQLLCIVAHLNSRHVQHQAGVAADMLR